MIGIWPEITFAQFPLDIITCFRICNPEKVKTVWVCIDDKAVPTVHHLPQ